MTVQTEDRIARAFAAARAEGRTPVFPFIPAGWPEIDATVEIVEAAVAGGAAGVEIGLPFSDPMGDGPTNQRAYEEAIRNGANAETVFAAVRELRARGVSVPLIVMGYVNPLLSYGISRFVQTAAEAGVVVDVAFSPGRTDATDDQTDAISFAVLEPTIDGFRNHQPAGDQRRPEYHLVDRAAQMTLSAPEMTVLVGGLRVLGANTADSTHGVFTDRSGVLSTDFFTNLLDMSTVWTPSADPHVYEGRDRSTGDLRWTATAADLVFGSNSQLRALAEVYASADANEKFVADFVAAWTKVMDLDRFDLR